MSRFPPDDEERSPFITPRRLFFAFFAGVALFAGSCVGLYVTLFSLGSTSPTSTPTAAPSGDTPTPTPSATLTAAGLPGTWSATVGSTAGYRVMQSGSGLATPTEVEAKTDGVNGELVIEKAGSGLVVSGIQLEFDLSGLRSDDQVRDQALRTSGLETDTFPTADFALLAPVALPGSLDPAIPQPVTVTGSLTLHGVTRAVTADCDVTLLGRQIEVSGSLPVTLADYEIAAPDLPGVEVAPDATIEFDLRFERTLG